MRATIAITAALVAVAAVTWGLNHNDAMTEIDETAWVLTSGQIREAVDRRTLSAESWHAPSATNHPPVGKALFALALAPGGLWIEDTKAHERWLVDALRVFHRTDLMVEWSRIATPAHLSRARLVPAFALVVAGLCLFVTVRRAFGALAGAVGTALFVLAPVVLRISSQAVSDMPFCAGVIATVALAVAIADARTPRRRVVLALALGVCCGLVMNLKLNGAASLPIALLAFAAAVWARARDAQRAWPSLAIAAVVATAAFVVVAYATNPAFYGGPLTELQAALDHRLLAVEEQKIIFYSDWLRTPALRVSGVAHSLQSLTPLGSMGLALLLGLAAAGAASGSPGQGSPGQGSPGQGAPSLALAAVSVAWIALTFATCVFRWERYALPAAPFVAAYAGVGAVAVARAVQRRVRSMATDATAPSAHERRIAITGAGAALLGAVLGGIAAWGSMDLDQARNPDEWHAMRMRQVDFMLAREPNDPILHARKAWVLEQRALAKQP